MDSFADTFSIASAQSHNSRKDPTKHICEAWVRSISSKLISLINDSVKLFNSYRYLLLFNTRIRGAKVVVKPRLKPSERNLAIVLQWETGKKVERSSGWTSSWSSFPTIPDAIFKIFLVSWVDNTTKNWRYAGIRRILQSRLSPHSVSYLNDHRK